MREFAVAVQDGDVSDHALALDAVVAASDLPISIVVAGLKAPVSGGCEGGRGTSEIAMNFTGVM